MVQVSGWSWGSQPLAAKTQTNLPYKVDVLIKWALGKKGKVQKQ